VSQLAELIVKLVKSCIFVCVRVFVNQDGTIHIVISACNPACTDLLMNSDHMLLLTVGKLHPVACLLPSKILVSRHHNSSFPFCVLCFAGSCVLVSVIVFRKFVHATFYKLLVGNFTRFTTVA